MTSKEVAKEMKKEIKAITGDKKVSVTNPYGSWIMVRMALEHSKEISEAVRAIVNKWENDKRTTDERMTDYQTDYFGDKDVNVNVSWA